MASRVVTFISCTLYVTLLIGSALIALAPFVVGTIGVGLYIPTSIIYDLYKNNTCFILDLQYDSCNSVNKFFQDTCYSIMWSVEYYILNSTSSLYVFTTITKTYPTLEQVLGKIIRYKERSHHICYYDKTHIANVQWNEPSSPTSYLIMIIIGFSLTGMYLIIFGSFYLYRSKRKMNN
jgi:hypothetical protein